ncbi:hypothetical protein LXL04_030712 [Taraxacum kok-saghyz]
MDFLKNHHRHHSSAASNRSISDTDSELHDFHSPLRADSPLRFDEFSSPTSTAIVSVDKYQTPFRSPLSNSEKSSHTITISPLAKAQPPPAAASYNRSAKADALTGVDGGTNKTRAPVTPIARKSRREVTSERAALVCRVCEVILTLIAFSVMASDETQGWSGDSFDRYKEYRYLVALNAIAFTYAAFQFIDLTYQLIYQKHLLTYSLPATRIDDWASNWGKDEFTKKASVSVVMSFLSFGCFAISSLISGYNGYSFEWIGLIRSKQVNPN